MWTVQKFIELLKRHDAGKDELRIGYGEGSMLISSWLDLESLVEELNEKEKANQSSVT